MSGYIMDIRKSVGHSTVIQCAASIIILDDQNRVLLGKRSDNHMWGYSGGSVEIDEKIEDCARRELLEEMGIEALNMEFFYVNSGAEVHYVYPNGDEVSNIEIVFICRDWRGEPRMADGEVEELGFFNIDEITVDEISPPIRPVWRKLVERFDELTEMKVGLHDCRIDHAEIKDGVVTFDFPDGFFVLNGKEPKRTGKAKMTCRLADTDMEKPTVYVYVEKDGNVVREDWSERFFQALNRGEFEFEFVTTFNSYERVLYKGYIWSDTAPYHSECEIELHTAEIKYTCEPCKNEPRGRGYGVKRRKK